MKWTLHSSASSTVSEFVPPDSKIGIFLKAISLFNNCFWIITAVEIDSNVALYWSLFSSSLPSTSIIISFWIFALKYFICSTILELLSLSLLIEIDIGLKVKTSFTINNLSLIKVISGRSLCNSKN